MHVNAYAELLFRWQLLKQRAELLKSIKDQTKDWSEYRLGISIPGDLRSPGGKSQTVRCTFCRLPVKGWRFLGFEISIIDNMTGLSFTCIRCAHVMHLKCRNVNQHFVCAAGCGCLCGDGGLGTVDISHVAPQYF